MHSSNYPFWHSLVLANSKRSVNESSSVSKLKACQFPFDAMVKIVPLLLSTSKITSYQLHSNHKHYFLERKKKTRKEPRKRLTLRKLSKSISLLKSAPTSFKILLISSSSSLSVKAFNFAIRGGKSPTVTLPFWFFTDINYTTQEPISNINKSNQETRKATALKEGGIEK